MRGGVTCFSSVALLVMSIALMPESAGAEKIKVMNYGIVGIALTNGSTLTKAKSVAAREAKDDVPEAIRWACYCEANRIGLVQDFHVIDFNINDVTYYVLNQSNFSTVVAEINHKVKYGRGEIVWSVDSPNWDWSHNNGWVYALADADGVCTYNAPRGNEEPSSRSTDTVDRGNSVSSTDVVSSAIDKIRNQPHSAIPRAESIVPDDPRDSGVRIENATGHTLTVYFSGPASPTITIAPGDSAMARLPEGRYEMAAEVPHSAIQPFYGRHTQEVDTQYRFRFFVESH